MDGSPEFKVVDARPLAGGFYKFIIIIRNYSSLAANYFQTEQQSALEAYRSIDFDRIKMQLWHQYGRQMVCCITAKETNLNANVCAKETRKGRPSIHCTALISYQILN